MSELDDEYGPLPTDLRPATDIFDDEVARRDYACAIGCENHAREIGLHVKETHAVVSTLPADLQSAWAMHQRLMITTTAHFHMTAQQAERVQKILDRAKDTAFAKAMAKYRLDSSATLRWWVHAHSRGVTP